VRSVVAGRHHDRWLEAGGRGPENTPPPTLVSWQARTRVPMIVSRVEPLDLAHCQRAGASVDEDVTEFDADPEWCQPSGNHTALEVRIRTSPSRLGKWAEVDCSCGAATRQEWTDDAFPTYSSLIGAAWTVHLVGGLPLGLSAGY